jgi:hypothetical protein
MQDGVQNDNKGEMSSRVFVTSKEMSEFVVLKRVVLGDHHLRPGRTRHHWNGKDFPPFVSLEIAQYPKDSGFYLLHICATGEIADTWHESLEDAMHQAEFEFGVQKDEWLSVSP